MRTLVSSAVMQLLSRGQWPLREELHACDPGPEPTKSGVAVPRSLVDGLDKEANRGTDRGREALRRSLRTYGAGRSIVIDKRGRILGGHKTVEQAKHLGLPVTVVRLSPRPISRVVFSIACALPSGAC